MSEQFQREYRRIVSSIGVFIALVAGCSKHDAAFAEPSPTIKVEIKGQVQHPGVYEVKAGESLDALVSLAGGPTKVAQLRSVSVISHKNGIAEAHFYRLPSVSDAPAERYALQSGDVVYVPERLKW